MTGEKTRSGTRSVEKELEIDAPLEAVWKALTDAEEVKRWFALDARVSPGVNGSLWWGWGEGVEWPSKIEIWEPNRHLRATYTFAPTREKGSEFPSPLAMDFYLESRGGKTVLRVVHSGFGKGPGWDDEYDGVSRGWTVELRSLRHYLENHCGTPRAVALVRHRTDVPHAEAWKRLLSPQGLLREGSLENLREGDRYSITAATGDRLEGVVQFLAPPQGFSGTVEKLNKALFRVHLEELLGVRQAWVWLSTYGLPRKEVDAFRDRWQNLLDKLFPGKPNPDTKETRQ